MSTTYHQSINIMVNKTTPHSPRRIVLLETYNIEICIERTSMSFEGNVITSVGHRHVETQIS
jgi:hypothetical protein